MVPFTGSATAITAAGLPSTAMNSAVAPSRRRSVGLRSKGAASRCRVAASTPALPSATAASAHLAGDALAGARGEVGRVPESDAPLARRRHDRGGERMFARPLEARGQGSMSASDEPPAGTMAVTLGLPSVSVPVLSTTSVSTFSMRSSASADLIRMPAPAPLPDPDADAHRRGEAERAGTGDDQHRDGRDQPIGQRAAPGPKPPRPTKARTATASTAGTK